MLNIVHLSTVMNIIAIGTISYNEIGTKQLVLACVDVELNTAASFADENQRLE